MKIFYSFLFLIFCSLAFSSLVLAQESYYYDSLTGEEVEIDCSNVLDFLDRYFSLNTHNQQLMLISANHLTSMVAGRVPEDIEEQNKIIEDLGQLSFLVGDNTIILEDLAYSIMDVLPTCLKPVE